VRRPLPWFGLAIRLAAASIWLVAGVSKLADLTQFHAQVDAYKLLAHPLEAPFAYTLPLVEVCLGIYLAIGLFVRPAAIFACALIVVFIAALARSPRPLRPARPRDAVTMSAGLSAHGPREERCVPAPSP
jgi:uncharacterized membrane protein YphA (DoxX/SURF4 family)